MTVLLFFIKTIFFFVIFLLYTCYFLAILQSLFGKISIKYILFIFYVNRFFKKSVTFYNFRKVCQLSKWLLLKKRHYCFVLTVDNNRITCSIAIIKEIIQVNINEINIVNFKEICLHISAQLFLYLSIQEL